MRTFIHVPAAIAAAVILVACGEKKSPNAEATAAPQAQPAPATAAPTPAQPAEATPTATPSVKPEATPAPAPAPAPPKPRPAAKPVPESAPKAEAVPPPAPKTEPAAPSMTPPPPLPTGAASTHAKVGADKCKMCHRVQHQSWAESPHAAKGLDCEGCHGNGGDYWPAGVMRDRTKAEAAGLVTPTLSSCRKCHGAKADTALFAKVHAHNVK